MKLWPFGKKAETKAASYIYGMGALRMMNQDYHAYATEGYGINAVVRGCVDKIALAIPTVDIKVMRKTRSGQLENLESHPILDLFERPCGNMTGEDFLADFMRYYLISGNAYVLGTGIDYQAAKPQIKEMHLLNPQSMRIIDTSNYYPDAYEHRYNGGSTLYPVNQINGMCAVMHKKSFNPLESRYGLSAMAAAAFSVDTLNEGDKWNLRLLQNEGRPSGALVVKAGDGNAAVLADEQYKRLREMIDQQFSGSENAGRPMLLEGGLDWREMSMNAKDMDHERNMNKAARQIALAYGVPPMLLGIPGDNTYSNMAEARLAMWTDTILPLLRSVLGSFNTWLAPIYGQDIVLWYDEDMIPALEPLRKSKADRVEASTTMTLNEKRRAMGMDDYEGADVLLVDGNKIPVDLVGDMGLSEAAPARV